MSLASLLAVAVLMGMGIVRSEPADRPPEMWGTILGPTTSGQQVDISLPTDAEVLRVLRIEPRFDIRVRLTKVCQYTDPPRIYPLLGPAQLHHTQYECQIDDATGTRRARINQNHLHIVGE